MATLTVQEIDLTTGLAPTYATAGAGGDEYANDGKTYLHVKNGGGAPITVTVAAQQATVDDPQFGRIVPANRAFTVTNGAERIIPYVASGGYNNANGRVAVTYSAVTSVTVAAIRAPLPQ
jgi:hypothetical protein